MNNSNNPEDDLDEKNDQEEKEKLKEEMFNTFFSFSNQIKKKNKSSNDLEQYGTNLNNLIKSGIADGFSGREDIIKKLIENLSRKDNPNCILIGNPGTGKTAIVQYLAKLITLNAVPDCLQNHIIYSIDINELTSDTMFRGQLEAKIKNIINIASRSRNIILFFDEFHMLKTAGDSMESQSAVINALKPAITNGMFKVIGATTLEEFNSAYSKETAFLRRFQTIEVADLSKEEILKIIENKIPIYEEFHKVTFNRSNTNLIYDLAEKYITDKFFPSKAFDVLDIILTKEKLSTFDPKNKTIDLTIKLAELKEEKERALFEENFEKAEELRKQILYIDYQLNHNKQNNKENINNNISKTETAYHAVRDISNNDIVDPSISIRERFLNLPKTLSNYIIGQQNAIEKTSTLIQNARFGLPDKNKPFATLLFLGPTGTGKTLLAKKLAESIFGNKNFYKFDMSEYDSEVSSNKLIGANPGFVGYREPSLLQVAVKTNPFSVFLFDEIEKAHPKILDLFLQILDEGRITTNNGILLNFTNSIIIMTSNIGSNNYKESSKIALDPSARSTENSLEDRVKSSLYDYLRPEFINRFDDIIVFNKIKKEDQIKIVELEINYIKKLANQKNITFSVTQKAIQDIAEKSFSNEFGARNIRRYVQKNINYAISNLIMKLDQETDINIEIDLIDNKYIANKI